MAYQRTTIDVYVVQCDYGYGHRWEDECSEFNVYDARQRRQEYRENCPYPVRIVKRREKRSEYTPEQLQAIERDNRTARQRYLASLMARCERLA